MLKLLQIADEGCPLEAADESSLPRPNGTDCHRTKRKHIETDLNSEFLLKSADIKGINGAHHHSAHGNKLIVCPFLQTHP